MGLVKRLVLGVVMCLVFGCPPVSGISQSELETSCIREFQFSSYVFLCNDPSSKRDEIICTGPAWQGFVVEDLFTGSPTNHNKCVFSNSKLLSVDCMKNATRRSERYDQIIFEILETVSGKGKIGKEDKVPGFPLELSSPEPSIAVNTSGDVPNISPQTVVESLFVAFKKICKPVMPLPETDYKVIDICTNTTVNDSRVYLTVRKTLQNSLPSEPSMCRCNIHKNSAMNSISLRALDIRLQNYTTHECGGTNIKLDWNEQHKKISCKGKQAMYGSKDLLSDKGVIQDVTLTLTAVNADSFPTAVWIEAFEGKSYESLLVTCEGFLPMPTTPDPGDDKDDGDKETDPDALGAGTNMGVIIGAVGGGIVFLVIVIIVVVIIVRRRHSGRFLPTFCSRGSGSGKYKHQKVPTFEPVYSEPGCPRPSNSEFVFPESVYAEPQEGSGKNNLHSAPPPTIPPPIPTTPPPLPDNHPAGVPPTGVSNAPPTGVSTASPTGVSTAPPTGVSTAAPTGVSVKFIWPPKPARTFSDSQEPVEDYDRINHTLGKPKLKPVSARARDGQNNIIGVNKSDGDDPATSNVYSHLMVGEDSSQTSTVGKKGVEVKDNVYNTTA